MTAEELMDQFQSKKDVYKRLKYHCKGSFDFEA